MGGSLATILQYLNAKPKPFQILSACLLACNPSVSQIMKENIYIDYREAMKVRSQVGEKPEEFGPSSN
jgi:hypothetical protein